MCLLVIFKYLELSNMRLLCMGPCIFCTMTVLTSRNYPYHNILNILHLKSIYRAFCRYLLNFYTMPSVGISIYYILST